MYLFLAGFATAILIVSLICMEVKRKNRKLSPKFQVGDRLRHNHKEYWEDNNDIEIIDIGERFYRYKYVNSNEKVTREMDVIDDCYKLVIKGCKCQCKKQE